MYELTVSYSDMAAFRRCKRKWDYTSRNRMDLQPLGDMPGTPLIFGSAFHYALEDYHGHRLYASPADAFEDYIRLNIPAEIQDAYVDQVELASDMLSYYVQRWLPTRNEFSTYVYEGIPMVEVPFEIPIRIDRKDVLYIGQFDRIVIDAYGRLWIQDYKTTAQISTAKLDIDSQVSHYTWAGYQLFGEQIEGVLYTQFRKAVPELPKVLKDGSLSTDRTQKTSYHIYREALRSRYGSPSMFPAKNAEFLNYLLSYEGPEGDTFIRRNLVRRNMHQVVSTMRDIQFQLREMLEGERLLVYPNPTRDCDWDCPMRTLCISEDDGSDFDSIRKMNYTRRHKENNEDSVSWRNLARFKLPQTPALSPSAQLGKPNVISKPLSMATTVQEKPN